MLGNPRGEVTDVKMSSSLLLPRRANTKRTTPERSAFVPPRPHLSRPCRHDYHRAHPCTIHSDSCHALDGRCLTHRDPCSASRGDLGRGHHSVGRVPRGCTYGYGRLTWLLLRSRHGRSRGSSVEGCSSDGGGSRRCDDDDDAARGSLKGGTKETCAMIRDEKSESESA